MPDWTKSMQQTFEYYKVDPNTWKDVSMIDKITKTTISWDADSETLLSASIDCTDSLGECYVRVYLITIQNGVRERFPLATVLIQTPSTSFDGRVQSISLDAYSPLIELKEKYPPLGYGLYLTTTSGGKIDVNVMDTAYTLASENMRAPVTKTSDDTNLYSAFVADTSETWLSFLTDLIANAEFTFSLDERGNVSFAPDQETSALQPVWTYTDDNSSILLPDIDVNRDLYGLPNVVEVIYSADSGYLYSKVVNDDPNSPISTINRGREVVSRVTDPDISGTPTQEMIDVYAEKLLKNSSALEYTLSYTHGYCPVRIGDCVLLNYERAGLTNVKAKVTSQSITCEPGCQVSETAVFTTNLWE